MTVAANLTKCNGMGHTNTLTAKVVDFTPVEIGIKEACAILAKVPPASLKGLNYKLIKEIREDLLAGKWPTDHIISFELDGTLFRGHNLLYAIAGMKTLKNPVTVLVIAPTPKTDHDARRIAIETKAPRYFTGRPCKRGHIAERFSSCGRCIECHRLKKQERCKLKKAAKKFRIKKFGFDPLDLRMKRKERGLKPSDSPALVRLREKRKRLGRLDRPKKPSVEAHQDT